MTYSTLSADDPALRLLIDRIRSVSGDPARIPVLPHSPFPGDADAGWLAGQENENCGYAWIRRQTGKRALVEIDALPSELDRVFDPLLTACLDQALAWECSRLVAYVPEESASLAENHSRTGFTPSGMIGAFRIDLSEDLPDPAVPEGYFLIPYHELRHLPTLAALLHRAYHDKFSRPEYETDGVTVETVRAEIEAHPEAGIERDYLVLLNFLGKGVGVVRSRGPDWIDGPGVVPEERGNDLQLALAFSALRRLRSRGASSARMIAFDEDPARIEDYRRAGFTFLEMKTCWQKELP